MSPWLWAFGSLGILGSLGIHEVRAFRCNSLSAHESPLGSRDSVSRDWREAVPPLPLLAHGYEDILSGSGGNTRKISQQARPLFRQTLK